MTCSENWRLSELKKIKYYIDKVDDELHGAKRYAEDYIVYIKTEPSWSSMYHGMAEQELNHAKNIITMGQEFVDDLPWLSEEWKELWGECTRHYAECVGKIQQMLNA